MSADLDLHVRLRQQGVGHAVENYLGIGGETRFVEFEGDTAQHHDIAAGTAAFVHRFAGERCAAAAQGAAGLIDDGARRGVRTLVDAVDHAIAVRVDLATVVIDDGATRCVRAFVGVIGNAVAIAVDVDHLNRFGCGLLHIRIVAERKLQADIEDAVIERVVTATAGKLVFVGIHAVARLDAQRRAIEVVPQREQIAEAGIAHGAVVVVVAAGQAGLNFTRGVVGLAVVGGDDAVQPRQAPQREHHGAEADTLEVGLVGIAGHVVVRLEGIEEAGEFDVETVGQRYAEAELCAESIFGETITVGDRVREHRRHVGALVAISLCRRGDQGRERARGQNEFCV